MKDFGFILHSLIPCHRQCFADIYTHVPRVQAVVTAIQEVDEVSREEAERRFTAGVAYTPEELSVKHTQLYVWM